MKKILPYIIITVVVVIGVKTIDHFTDTGDIDAEKKELIEDVNVWRKKFIEVERERSEIQKENIVLKQEIEKYETENDTVITAIRTANNNRDFARLDSLGDKLLDRLRRRR